MVGDLENRKLEFCAQGRVGRKQVDALPLERNEGWNGRIHYGTTERCIENGFVVELEPGAGTHFLGEHFARVYVDDLGAEGIEAFRKPSVVLYFGPGNSRQAQGLVGEIRRQLLTGDELWLARQQGKASSCGRNKAGNRLDGYLVALNFEPEVDLAGRLSQIQKRKVELPAQATNGVVVFQVHRIRRHEGRIQLYRIGLCLGKNHQQYKRYGSKVFQRAVWGWFSIDILYYLLPDIIVQSSFVLVNQARVTFIILFSC